MHSRPVTVHKLLLILFVGWPCSHCKRTWQYFSGACDTEAGETEYWRAFGSHVSRSDLKTSRIEYLCSKCLLCFFQQVRGRFSNLLLYYAHCLFTELWSWTTSTHWRLAGTSCCVTHMQINWQPLHSSIHKWHILTLIWPVWCTNGEFWCTSHVATDLSHTLQ